ncbi:MAG TPA: ABC transporter ATP-binding protein [Acidimicrobiales bacterium]|nr:ABC transporter ATP-binding protein [Acidimicrobiales bacterium]
MADVTTEAAVPVRGPGRRPVLECVELKRWYRTGSTRARSTVVKAVDGVSFALYAGEITALVGESGSGKSTVARVLAQLEGATDGRVVLDGQAVKRSVLRFRRYARRVQLIFQDPFSSLNPTHRVDYVLSRPLRIHGFAKSRKEVEQQSLELLEQVELTPARQFLHKFPHELSGGQRQRVAVARALGARPEVILADEPVSMLDVSIRLSVLNLLRRLVEERDVALLYITHDIASARYFAKTTLVMYAGRLAEGGDSEEVTQRPAHPYTQLLIKAAPDPGRVEEVSADAGEPPSLARPPVGCRFHPRCPHAMPVCKETPPRVDLEGNHWVDCWLYVDRPDEPRRAPAGTPG